MNARDELFECMTPTHCRPAPGEAESVNALLDAYATEVRKAALEEAEELAEAEGYRLYDDTGLKAAEAAWGVSDKIRQLAESSGLPSASK